MEREEKEREREEEEGEGEGKQKKKKKSPLASQVLSPHCSATISENCGTLFVYSLWGGGERVV